MFPRDCFISFKPAIGVSEGAMFTLYGLFACLTQAKHQYYSSIDHIEFIEIIYYFDKHEIIFIATRYLNITKCYFSTPILPQHTHVRENQWCESCVSPQGLFVSHLLKVSFI